MKEAAGSHSVIFALLSSRDSKVRRDVSFETLRPKLVT